MVINYNGEDFNKLTKKKVLVDFYANWCGPCKMLAPLLENISKEIDVIKVEVDNYEELSRKYGVMSIPCLILFEDNNEQKRNIGFLEEDKLKEFIEK